MRLENKGVKLLIYFIGPGGAGKTTTAKLLASQLECTCYDLDEYFMALEGDIEQYISEKGYERYASRNLELFLELKEKLQSNSINVIVCSSGFMTYPNQVHGGYIKIKKEVENHPFTFLLLPSLDLERCVQLIVKRQMARSYLNSKVEKEEFKIRSRFNIYAGLKCHLISIEQAPHMVVVRVLARLNALAPLSFL
ncbi:shikimate kinase [Acinetobacter sp. BIGb0102]|nr:shikimate kinase [Acinetobacter sp. BIGb0102]